MLMLVLTAGTRVPTALRRRALARRRRWLLMFLGALCGRPALLRGKEPVARGQGVGRVVWVVAGGGRVGGGWR